MKKTIPVLTILFLLPVLAGCAEMSATTQYVIKAHQAGTITCGDFNQMIRYKNSGQTEPLYHYGSAPITCDEQ